jgi:hypothetical protein
VNSSTQRVLAAADWNQIGRELAAFAQYLLNNRTWRTGDNINVAGGRQALDFVQEALEQMSGFDAERGELLPYLKTLVLRSVSNLSRSAENRHEVSIRSPHDGDGEDETEDADAYLDRQRVQDAAPSPEEILAGPGERVTALFEAVDGDQPLTELLDAAMEIGETTAQPLAKHLKTTTADINNRLKRLRRIAGKVAPKPTPAKDLDARKQANERTTA